MRPNNKNKGQRELRYHPLLQDAITCYQTASLFYAVLIWLRASHLTKESNIWNLPQLVPYLECWVPELKE